MEKSGYGYMHCLMESKLEKKSQNSKKFLTFFLWLQWDWKHYYCGILNQFTEITFCLRCLAPSN